MWMLSSQPRLCLFPFPTQKALITTEDNMIRSCIPNFVILSDLAHVARQSTIRPAESKIWPVSAGIMVL